MSNLFEMPIELLQKQIEKDEWLMDFVAACPEGTISLEKQQALFARYIACTQRLKELTGGAHGENER